MDGSGSINAKAVSLTVGDGFPVPKGCEFAGSSDINETVPAGTGNPSPTFIVLVWCTK